MSTINKFFLIVTISTLLGFGSVLFTLDSRIYKHDIENGAWKGILIYPKDSLNFYNKAYIALKSPFMLNSLNALYFTAEYDSDGNIFSGECEYKIQGNRISARVWSLSVYEKNLKNQVNSYSSENTKMNSNNTFTIYIGSTKKEHNWIKVGDQPFKIVLRIYNPHSTILNNLNSISMPSIIKEKCK